MNKPAIQEPANAGDVVSPSKLAHIVMRTSRYDEMIRWYRTTLHAAVAYESATLTFLSYDDEHHRVAFIKIDGLAEQPHGIAGVHHVAFTYASLHELLNNFALLKAQGIEPVWCVNHGPTTSMYYEDPDGNQVELQVDNYDSAREADEFILSEAFSVNPIGVDFDPEALRRQLLAGADEQALKRRPASGPRGVDGIRLH